MKQIKPNGVCKKCGREYRRNGSSIGENCAQKYETAKFQNERLEKKVEQASKINN